jgi:hypothetical protein
MKRLLGVVMAVSLGAIGLSVGAADNADRTLNRSEDPVVVTADQLEALQGQTIAGLALLRWQNGGFEPIPFQVDERNPAGDFCFDQGPKANAKECNGLLDGKDELSFMAADAGGRAPAEAARPAGAGKSAELELDDPVAGGKAWVYLMAFAANPPRSKADYVKHELKDGRNWVLTDRYQFAEIVSEAYFDRFMMREADGSWSPNLVDQIKGRSDMKAAHGMISFRILDRSTRSDCTAWKDGQVRVIHHMEGYLKAGGPLKIGKAAGGANNVFYRNYFYTPIFFGLPFKPGTFLSEFDMYYVIDWNPATAGMHYFDPVNRKGATLDGHMDADELKLDTETPHPYWALTGTPGSILVRMMAPDKWSKVVSLKLYYVDDDSKRDDPDNFPGQRETGFKLAGIKDVEKGLVQYSLHYFVPAGPINPDNVKPIMDIIDHPLRVKTSAGK